MPLRTKIFIFISIGVLIVLSVSVLLLVQAKRPTENSTPNQNQPPLSETTNGTPETVVNQATEFPAGLLIKPATDAEAERQGVSQLARAFVERYYSYSTDSNYQNAGDVQPMVTALYWRKIQDNFSSIQPDSFSGVTTDVVGITSASIDGSEATVGIQARRTLEKDGNSTITPVKYTITLVKTGSTWLINNSALVQ